MSCDRVADWSDIPGYEGLYQASKGGQIKSLARTAANGRRLAETIMRQGRQGDYSKVNLSRCGQKRTFRVHQLIAKTFLADSYFPGAEVCHGDGIHTNNFVSNLRWGTTAGNHLDSVRHGTHPQASRVQCPQGHWYSPENTRVEHIRGGGKARRCRTCTNQWQRQYRAAKRAGVAA